jgi:hypothetical protein
MTQFFYMVAVDERERGEKRVMERILKLEERKRST